MVMYTEPLVRKGWKNCSAFKIDVSKYAWGSIELRRHNTANLHSVINSPQLKDMDNRNIKTRAHDALMFKVRIPKTEMYKRLVEYTGAEHLNRLDTETRNTVNLQLFQRKQKALMMNFV